MSHDLHASWAASELAQQFRKNHDYCFAAKPGTAVSAYAARESKKKWPIADGVVWLETDKAYPLALEFKRRQEGLHGVLTAIGQSHAYLHKGFSGALIVIPLRYESHATAAEHVGDILDTTNPSSPISVFGYEDPDPSSPKPFGGKIKCIRKMDLGSSPSTKAAKILPQGTETQWAHLREGSSEPDAFYQYLRIAQTLDIKDTEPGIDIETGLADAARKCDTKHHDPAKYLSYTIGDSVHERIWRRFWFENVLTRKVSRLWSTVKKGVYQADTTSSELLHSHGTKKKSFFTGRKDSVKNKLIDSLNKKSINEQSAWEKFAQNVRNRAHSYREDIDSGLEALGMLGEDGRPTDTGYKYVSLCERTGGPHSRSAMKMLGTAVLREGELITWLHYVHRLSEEKFSNAPLSFTSPTSGTKLKFLSNDYKVWLEDQLRSRLCVIRKVSLRSSKNPRPPFQGELAVLRNLDIVGDFRVGVGLAINWPFVQELYQGES